MADDDAPRPDPAGAAARSMTQLAQQMREMAERMLSGALPGWPVPGALGTSVGLRIWRCADPTATRHTGGPAPRTAAGSGAALPGLPAIPGMPPIPGLPGTPATMSARQLQAVVDDIAARRSQVQALIANLTVFDEQLGALETSLRPLLQWLRTWSEMESAVTDFWTPARPAPDPDDRPQGPLTGRRPYLRRSDGRLRWSSIEAELGEVSHPGSARSREGDE